MDKAVEKRITSSKLRLMAQHSVALEGINWQHIRSLEGETRVSQLLDEMILAEEEKIRSLPGVVIVDGNTLPAYGVAYKNLSSLRGIGSGEHDLNWKLCRQIWYGLNYVENPESRSGVPHEFLTSMNTFEILSLYRAFAHLIEYGDIPLGKEKETIPISELKEMPAELIVSRMVGYGLRHQALNSMRKKGYNGFPTGRGDLIKRIKPLSPHLKTGFIRLLDNQERTTEVTVRRGDHYDFHDTCYDGLNPSGKVRLIRGNLGREIYTRNIANFMEKLYAQNTH